MYLGMTWQEVLADANTLRELVTRVGDGGCAAVLRELGARPHVYYYDKLRMACLGYGIPVPKYRPPRAPQASSRARVSAVQCVPSCRSWNFFSEGTLSASHALSIG